MDSRAVFSPRTSSVALRVAEKIKGGQIYVNTYFSKGMIESPGTGWKQSGIGVAGIQNYMISKTVFVDLIDGSLPARGKITTNMMERAG